MKRLLAALTLALAAPALLGATRLPIGIIDRQGVERFPLDGSTPAVICDPNNVCVIEIELQPDETMGDIVCSKSVKRDPAHGWIVQQGSRGDRSPRIYVTPQDPFGSANLYITTSKREYALFLVATQKARYLRYGFIYPESEDRATVLRRHAAAEPTPTPAPSPTPRVVIRDNDYNVIGTAPFAPIHPYSIDSLMYLPLPDGTFPFPDVRAEAGDKTEPVAHTFETQTRTIVVQGLYEILDVLSGEGRGATVVRIVHGPLPTPVPSARPQTHPEGP